MPVCQNPKFQLRSSPKHELLSGGLYQHFILHWKSNSALHRNDDALIPGQSRRPAIGRFENQVDCLPRHRIGRNVQTRFNCRGSSDRDFAVIGVYAVLPPPHGDGVAVRIGNLCCESNRLTGMRGNIERPLILTFGS